MYVIRIAKSSRWDRCGYIVQGFTFCCEKKIAHNKTSKFFFKVSVIITEIEKSVMVIHAVWLYYQKCVLCAGDGLTARW